MKFTPRPHQIPIIDYMLNHDRALIFSGMGTGKTSATLCTIDARNLFEDHKTLIIAPLRVAQTTWPDEVCKWDEYKHLTISPIIGTTPAKRLQALRTPADIHTINYENLPWLLEQVGENWQWDTIIADESTRLKSFRLGGKNGRRARALAKVAFSKVKRFYGLTGTPSPNGLQDLWGQMWFIDRGNRLGRTYSAFMQRWFYPEHPNSFKMVPTINAQTEIMDLIKDCCLSIRGEDWFNIEEPVVVDIPVTLPPKAMKLYKQMEKEMYLEINEKEVEAFSAAAKTMKCLQMASGAVYTDDTGKFEIVHNEKLDALEEIIEEAAGMPVLVAYHFKSDLARLQKRFPQGRELSKDPKIIHQWNKGKIPVLFAHPASAGHGLNLQDGGNIIAFFSHWWNLEEYQQIIERIGPMRQMQAGHNRPVYIYNICAVNTIDELVIQRRTNKRKIQDILLERMRGDYGQPKV